jgi:hypothetical protein
MIMNWGINAACKYIGTLLRPCNEALRRGVVSKIWLRTSNSVVKQEENVILNILQCGAKTAVNVRKIAAPCGFLRAAPGRVVTVAVGGGLYGLQAADVAVVRSLLWIVSRRVHVTNCCLRASDSPSVHRACDGSAGIIKSFVLRVKFFLQFYI